MAAKAILISPKYRIALNTMILMSELETFRTGIGNPMPIDREAFADYVVDIYPDSDSGLFVGMFEDFIVESNENGILSAYDVEFDSTYERGYRFVTDGW